jgi:hypothetical protein
MARASAAATASATVFTLAALAWVVFLFKSLTIVTPNSDLLGKVTKGAGDETRSSTQEDADADRLAVAAAMPMPVSAPTPYPGNAIVNLGPQNLTNLAVRTHTTYMLAPGMYSSSGCTIPGSDSGVNDDHIQFLGAGIGQTIINVSGGHAAFWGGNGGNGTITFVQIDGIEFDCGNQNNEAINTNGANSVQFSNCLVKGYSSTVKGTELFPVYFTGPLGSVNTNVLIEGCRFTPGTWGNVDGTSVVSPTSVMPGNDTGCQVLNNTFDEPTDPGTLYYHCTGPANLIQGNVFKADGNSRGFSQFCYLEPGSQGTSAQTSDANLTCALTGNTIVLQPGSDFAGMQVHNNGQCGSFIIQGNDISMASGSGNVFHLITHNGPPLVPPAVKSVTLSGNTLGNGLTQVHSDFGGTTYIGSVTTQ